MNNIKEKFLAPFKEVTGVLKDIGWWLATLAAAFYFVRPYLGSQPANAGFHTASGILLFYALIRSIVYRRRNRRLYKAFRYVHQLMHKLRDHIGDELSHLDKLGDADIPDVPEEVLTKATIDSLTMILQDILDNASQCFRELTGLSCTSVLIMPERDEIHGNHFKSRLYSSDASNERIKSARPHKVGLVPMAFKSNDVCCFADLKEEMQKGNFVKRDPEDTFKWYRSAIMCHFKVCNDRWGVLVIDSPTVKAFRPYYNELLCAFSDALGLAFELSEHGDLGNHVYQNYTPQKES